MNVAVIGSGISGLTVANLLNKNHRVTLFEANSYIGGHTATKDIEIQNQVFAVDTGFIVYNDWTYPRFIELMDKFGIQSQPTSMGFSVTSRTDSLEYCGTNLNGLFSDRSNLFNPRFLGMIKDIVRFNHKAKSDLSNGRIDPAQELVQYLTQQRFGKLFIEGYILPMASAIWSASGKTVAEFQALFFLRFFKNHGLLNILRRPQWRVLKNGSRSYIPSMIEPIGDRVLTNSPVRSIIRSEAEVKILTDDSEHRFDQVVVATHSDQALAMLDDADQNESEILESIPYKDNCVTLHTDATILPRNRRAWTSWNYLLDQSGPDKPVLTYNMNILQRLDAPETICVTVNGDDYINQDKILSQYIYAHPQFSAASVSAQSRWSEINGNRRTWYCGAYWRNGFHEDGVESAMRVVEGFQSI